MGGVHRLAVPALLAILLLAPLVGAGALAAGRGGLNVSVETYNVTFTIPVYNQTVAIPANGSVTVDVNVPSYLNASDIAAVHIVMLNVTGQVQLTAYAGNSTVATATIVPLASGYHQTLPPTTTKVVLSASAAANATVRVYLETKPAQLKLVLDKTSLSLERGSTARVNITLEQVSGPSVYVWSTVQADYPLMASVYYMSNRLAIPWDSQHALATSGTGRKQAGYISITWPEDGQPKSNVAYVRVYFWADLNGVNPESAQLVATVDLSGSITDSVASLAAGQHVSAKSLGVGAVVGLILGVLLLGGLGRGRRGTTGELGPVVLLLVVLAAIGLSAGLIDVDTKFSIDPKMLGVGILAVLALLMLIRQGAVPAPRAVRKLLK